MLPATLPPELAELPLHARLMLAALAGSGITCLAVVLVGGVFRWRRQRAGMAAGLPPLPRAFPGAGDQLYTALFMLLILGGAAVDILPSTKSATQEQAYGWSAFLLGIAAQVGIYLPMLVRYGLLPPTPRPTRPWWQYLTLPLLVWAGIYLSILLLEVSGWSAWLVRTTGCPEHQDLVLTFSRGDNLQRLYIIICAVFVAPVAEEVCFRGFLYTTLRRWGGCVAAALASALLFGAIHASLAQLLPLMIFGVAQCIAYEKVRSLWLPIAVHMLFNTTSLIATALMLP